MKLCWSCYVKKQVQNNLPDEWDHIPNVEDKEECELCGINGIYVREIPQVERRIDIGHDEVVKKSMEEVVKTELGVAEFCSHSDCANEREYPSNWCTYHRWKNFNVGLEPANDYPKRD